jgi:hypothetical protein
MLLGAGQIPGLAWMAGEARAVAPKHTGQRRREIIRADVPAYVSRDPRRRPDDA